MHYKPQNSGCQGSNLDLARAEGKNTSAVQVKGNTREYRNLKLVVLYGWPEQVV